MIFRASSLKDQYLYFLMNLARLEASALGVAGISELGCDYEQSERMWKRVELFSWRQPIYERMVKREELFSWRQYISH